jgi:hypothetical protein
VTQDNPFLDACQDIENRSFTSNVKAVFCIRPTPGSIGRGKKRL